MTKLKQIGAGLNSYTFQFDQSLLDEIRESYYRELRPCLSDPENSHWFEGGRSVQRQPIGASSTEYFMVSFHTYPLLWISCNSDDTYGIYRRFFDSLNIEEDIKKLIDYEDKVVVYSGFLVVGNRAPEPAWHVDYEPGANAYTLLTPLFALHNSHGNLLYKRSGENIETYRYQLGESIIVGEKFTHSTEAYESSADIRILVSLTFGSDKLEYWEAMSQTLASQSSYLLLPCGHLMGKCICLVNLMAQKRLKNR